MPRPTTPSVIERFLGWSDLTSTEVDEREATIFRNCYIFGDGQELRRRLGTAPISAAVPPVTTDLDMLAFARILGIDHLVGLHGGTLKNFAADPPAVLTGGISRFATGVDANAAFLPDALYIGNGAGQNVRFDGTNVKTVTPSQPNVSLMTLNGAGSGSMTGTYNYRVTFLSADGQDSQASAISGSVTVSAKASINLASIPVAAAGEDCSGRRIWRIINGGTTWYLVGTINDNTTTTFSDTTLDSAVDTSQAVDLNAVRFPPCQILAAHQLRLCGVLSSGEGDGKTLYVSDQQRPWYCPEVVLLESVDDPTFGARIPLPDSPVGLVTYGNVLVIFFQNSAWRLIGDNPNNWSFDHWLNIGCVAHRTAQTYKGALLWLAADGVYAVEGSALGVVTNRISDDIKNSIDAISVSDLAKASAFIWNDRYYLCFPAKAYYYDFKYRIWGELTNWKWRATAVSQSSGTARERIYAAKKGAGQVFELETGIFDDNAVVPFVWRSRSKDFGQWAREKRVHRVSCQFKADTASDSGDVTVKLYRGAGELIQTFTQSLADPIRPGSDVAELDKHVVEGARDEFFALEIDYSGLSADFRVLQAGATWTLCT